MHTFFINTATHQTTIAVYKDELLLAEARWQAEQNEAEKLQPAVEALLEKNEMKPEDIDRLVVCIGPGGFTSSRVGVSAANAWAFAQQIPIAAVTVFDLYPDNVFVFLSANPNETWVKEPGKDPRFVQKDDLKLPDPFSFTGIVSEEWKEYLTGQGGVWTESEEVLPKLEELKFEQKPALPWYYKEPHITHSTRFALSGQAWSKKNDSGS